MIQRLFVTRILPAVTAGLVVLALGVHHGTFGVEAANTEYAIRIDTEKPVLTVLKNGRVYRTYPVALGKPETETPIGSWHVVDKQKDWGGGFGTRWMGLDVPWGTFGIHGTNRRSSIGTYASNGCIRMLNGDVEQLYEYIPLGTPVLITGNPLKHVRSLEYGNIGADVQLVQAALQKAGYYKGQLNGQFNQRMQIGLVYYQLAHRLPMDGVVDRDDYQTMGLLHGKASVKS